MYNENAKDVFFMEVTIKSYSNYVTDVTVPFLPLDLNSEEIKNYTISLRAFSLTRNLWIKDYQPLTDVIWLLKKENYLND